MTKRITSASILRAAKYSVKRYWEVCDSVEVEAESLELAIIKAHSLPLTAGEYVSYSINSDEDVDVEAI